MSRTQQRSEELGGKRIRDYRDLVVWQNSRALARRVYEVTARFPSEERFGLTQQLRRGAVSVVSNIAEGYGRGARKDYIRFLQMARGSLYEIQTQTILAEDLGFVSQEQAAPLLEDITRCARLLHGLIKSLQQKEGTGNREQATGTGNGK
jgi:four helix bundle protein